MTGHGHVALLLLLAAAQGYVSFRAQYTFVDHAKRAHVPSILEALGLDTGAVPVQPRAGSDPSGRSAGQAGLRIRSA